MIYIIEAFDKTTDLLVFEEKLPCGHDEKIKLIMDWTEEQWGWEGYDLEVHQFEALEKLLAKKVHDHQCFFQLTCNVSTR